MKIEDLEGYQRVQEAAKNTLREIQQFIKPGETEAAITEHCREIQHDFGVEGFWYKELPAVVLVGARTTLALSTTPYQPSDLQVQEQDLVTIDLNPEIAGYWGDYARGYYIEDGQTSRMPRQNPAFIDGASLQQRLHQRMFDIARPDMTFDALYQDIHALIEQSGYEQLDYLGHNIDRRQRKLSFMEPGAATRLGDVEMFTLEPHIRHRTAHLGYKHENMYYFVGDRLTEL